MDNASVETGGFKSIDVQLTGYHSLEQVIGAGKSGGTRNTRVKVQASIDSRNSRHMAHVLRRPKGESMSIPGRTHRTEAFIVA